jgi:hypothetical protein
MEVGIARRKRRMTQKASWRMEYWSVRILMSWALTALPFRNAGLIALNVFRASQRKVRVSLPECHDVNRNGPEEKRNFCRTNPICRKCVDCNNMQSEGSLDSDKIFAAKERKEQRDNDLDPVFSLRSLSSLVANVHPRLSFASNPG